MSLSVMSEKDEVLLWCFTMTVCFLTVPLFCWFVNMCVYQFSTQRTDVRAESKNARKRGIEVGHN